MNTEYINGICINTVVTDFKTSKVKGCVRENSDGSYTIFLNSQIGYHEMQKTIKHELSHIMNDDFQKYDINNIENNAHNSTY